MVKASCIDHIIEPLGFFNESSAILEEAIHYEQIHQ